MIELGDRQNRGFVDIDDFMWLMHKIGLIKKEATEISDIEREYNLLNQEVAKDRVKNLS